MASTLASAEKHAGSAYWTLYHNGTVWHARRDPLSKLWSAFIQASYDDYAGPGVYVRKTLMQCRIAIGAGTK